MAMKRHRNSDEIDESVRFHPRQRTAPFNKLPDGWLDCPAFGQEIDGCLIPSKVPLDRSFDDLIEPAKRYSFTRVIREQRRLGRTLGLVVDLTNTSRYYNASELKREGIKHVKIACQGRDSVPDNEAVNKFVYEVSWFLKSLSRVRKYVLVHCTHGHNRTGYMIVHYLVRVCAMSVTRAVQAFADARPPGIYKPDYLQALYEFYHEKKPSMVVCPSTPEWKRSSDDVDVGDGKFVGASVDKKTNDESMGMVMMTNDDVLGDKIPRGQELEFRQFCYQALKLNGGFRGPQQFPGSHPVSLNRDNSQMLRQCNYHVTWKADGTRYMMLITKDGCYLIDRHFNFRRVQMRFPCWQPAADEHGTLPEKQDHHFTLLDGEMVIDNVPPEEQKKENSPKQLRRYLIYDMMAINGSSIMDRPFKERWEKIGKIVIEPRNMERADMVQSPNPFYIYDLEPFRVRRKGFFLLPETAMLLKEFIPGLSHAADGLIFQGWYDPYVPRTHEGLLKWKYPEMNSVDFLFEMVGNRQLLSLYDRGVKKPLERNTVIFPGGVDPSTCTGKIIECGWDSVEKVWRYMRMRPDKGQPNGFYTYEKVMRSINDHITEDVLLNEINEIIRLPLYADDMQKYNARKKEMIQKLSRQR